MAKSNEIKKSNIILALYYQCFDENAANEKDERSIEFYKLLKKLRNENKITFSEANILESALRIDLEIFLQYIDSEPRIKVVIE